MTSWFCKCSHLLANLLGKFGCFQESYYSTVVLTTWFCKCSHLPANLLGKFMEFQHPPFNLLGKCLKFQPLSCNLIGNFAHVNYKPLLLSFSPPCCLLLAASCWLLAPSS